MDDDDEIVIGESAVFSKPRLCSRGRESVCKVYNAEAVSFRERKVMFGYNIEEDERGKVCTRRGQMIL